MRMLPWQSVDYSPAASVLLEKVRHHLLEDATLVLVLTQRFHSLLVVFQPII